MFIYVPPQACFRDDFVETSTSKETNLNCANTNILNKQYYKRCGTICENTKGMSLSRSTAFKPRHLHYNDTHSAPQDTKIKKGTNNDKTNATYKQPTHKQRPATEEQPAGKSQGSVATGVWTNQANLRETLPFILMQL